MTLRRPSGPPAWSRFREFFERFGKRLLLLGLSTAIALFALEAAARWGLASAAQRKFGAQALLLRDKNTFTPQADKQCTWGDSLIAHPYLEFVHHRRPPCGVEGANNAGMLSRYPLPLERDPHFFTILLSGGSVAQQLGSVPWLERAMEQRYQLGGGRTFRVIDAAMGATTYPRQAILTLLHGYAVDAIVAVDGFNEVSVNSPATGLLLGAPNQLYLSQIKAEGTDRLVARLELSRLLRERLSRVPGLSHSFLWYFLVERVSGAALGDAGETTGQGTPAFGRGTYLESYVAPPSWPLERRIAWHSERYLEGVRVNQLIAQSVGAKYAHFLQPVPNLFKPLTALERAAAWREFPSAYYLTLEKALTELNGKGTPTFSMLRLFDNNPAEIYSDMIHCNMNSTDSPGYVKMANWIAEQLGSAWGLTRRSSATQ